MRSRALGRPAADRRRAPRPARRTVAVALEDLHRGGLAGTVRPEQGEHLTLVNLEIDAVDRRNVAVTLLQSDHRDHRTHGWESAIRAHGPRLSRTPVAHGGDPGKPLAVRVVGLGMATDIAPARGRVRVEAGPKRVRAYLGGIPIVDSKRVVLVWENPNYPTYYFPADDVRLDLLVDTGQSRHSPSRGDAHIYDVRSDRRVAEGAATRYLDSPIEELRDLVTFTWDALDHWFEEDEEVRVHARSPYTRVDVLASSRRVKVVVDGTTVAESDHPDAAVRDRPAAPGTTSPSTT